ncbi:MAG: hypothetical protein OXC10_04570, partial [Rhodospirillaceae bacterium]|nr:hypothetical protein [Rhodospirillaceae bacterium]
MDGTRCSRALALGETLPAIGRPLGHSDIETAPARPEVMAAGFFHVIPNSIRRPERGKGSAMFRRRGEVEKFLAVAEAGRIVAAANRLA